FEVATQTNKYFIIERMGDVEILDQDIQHKAEHRYFKPDFFGLQGQKPIHGVEMEFNLRGMLLLREQYPASDALITRIGNEAHYRFKAKVQDFRAPGAYALRLPEKVLGSSEFLDYLQSLSTELS
ncbi:MAG: hypothetical protein ACKOAV_04150, partial [Bacteroidota bacterium]